MNNLTKEKKSTATSSTGDIADPKALVAPVDNDTTQQLALFRAQLAKAMIEPIYKSPAYATIRDDITQALQDDKLTDLALLQAMRIKLKQLQSVVRPSRAKTYATTTLVNCIYYAVSRSVAQQQVAAMWVAYQCDEADSNAIKKEKKINQRQRIDYDAQASILFDALFAIEQLTTAERTRAQSAKVDDRSYDSLAATYQLRLQQKLRKFNYYFTDIKIIPSNIEAALATYDAMPYSVNLGFELSTVQVKNAREFYKSFKDSDCHGSGDSLVLTQVSLDPLPDVQAFVELYRQLMNNDSDSAENDLKKFTLATRVLQKIEFFVKHKNSGFVIGRIESCATAFLGRTRLRYLTQQLLATLASTNDVATQALKATLLSELADLHTDDSHLLMVLKSMRYSDAYMCKANDRKAKKTAKYPKSTKDALEALLTAWASEDTQAVSVSGLAYYAKVEDSSREVAEAAAYPIDDKNVLAKTLDALYEELYGRAQLAFASEAKTITVKKAKTFGVDKTTNKKVDNKQVEYPSAKETVLTQLSAGPAYIADVSPALLNQNLELITDKIDLDSAPHLVAISDNENQGKYALDLIQGFEYVARIFSTLAASLEKSIKLISNQTSHAGANAVVSTTELVAYYRQCNAYYTVIANRLRDAKNVHEKNVAIVPNGDPGLPAAPLLFPASSSSQSVAMGTLRMGSPAAATTSTTPSTHKQSKVAVQSSAAGSSGPPPATPQRNLKVFFSGGPQSLLDSVEVPPSDGSLAEPTIDILTASSTDTVNKALGHASSTLSTSDDEYIIYDADEIAAADNSDDDAVPVQSSSPLPSALNSREAEQVREVTKKAAEKTKEYAGVVTEKGKALWGNLRSRF